MSPVTPLPAPYRPAKIRKPSPPPITNRVSSEKEEEGLTGYVQGWEASDIEERFARALDDMNLQYSFRDHYFGPARNTPGAIEVDFMVENGGYWPVQIDGEYAHRTAQQRERDRLNDARLNQYFNSHGVNVVSRVPDGNRFMVGDLDTQEGANMVVEDLFG